MALPDVVNRDLLAFSDVIRRNELQAWFVASHGVSVPLTHAT